LCCTQSPDLLTTGNRLVFIGHGTNLKIHPPSFHITEILSNCYTYSFVSRTTSHNLKLSLVEQESPFILANDSNPFCRKRLCNPTVNTTAQGMCLLSVCIQSDKNCNICSVSSISPLTSRCALFTALPLLILRRSKCLHCVLTICCILV